RVPHVGERLGKARPAFDHLDAEAFGEGGVALEEGVDPLECQGFESDAVVGEHRLMLVAPSWLARRGFRRGRGYSSVPAGKPRAPRAARASSSASWSTKA